MPAEFATTAVEIADDVAPTLATSAHQVTQNTKLDTLHADIAALQALVDGLEGKDYATQTTLAAVASTLTSIAGNVDQLEGYTDTLEALLTTLQGYVDGLETAEASNLTKLEAIRALLAGTLLVGSTPAAGDGRKVVTTAGTRVVLAASTPCKWVKVTAETDNTGVIVLGLSTVVAALATRRGTPLYAGDTAVMPIDDLANAYIDSTVSTDGVTFVYG